MTIRKIITAISFIIIVGVSGIHASEVTIKTNATVTIMDCGAWQSGIDCVEIDGDMKCIRRKGVPAPIFPTCEGKAFPGNEFTKKTNRVYRIDWKGHYIKFVPFSVKSKKYHLGKLLIEVIPK